MRRGDRAFDARGLRRLFRAAGDVEGTAARAEALSRALLGRPYRAASLVGSAEEPERFVAPLDGFDCVTFVETVYAAARARGEEEFAGELVGLRYRDGEVAWPKRNHYMADWIRNNRDRLRPLSFGAGAIAKSRLLSVVPGLPPRRRAFRCLPKGLVPREAARLRTGDLVCFASTKSNLDVFHCGLIVKEGGELRLRHASRSLGRVVEEPLAAFLARNRTSGILAARPVERRRA